MMQLTEANPKGWGQYFTDGFQSVQKSLTNSFQATKSAVTHDDCVTKKMYNAGHSVLFGEKYGLWTNKGKVAAVVLFTAGAVKLNQSRNREIGGENLSKDQLASQMQQIEGIEFGGDLDTDSLRAQARLIGYEAAPKTQSVWERVQGFRAVSSVSEVAQAAATAQAAAQVELSAQAGAVAQSV